MEATRRVPAYISKRNTEGKCSAYLNLFFDLKRGRAQGKSYRLEKGSLVLWSALNALTPVSVRPTCV
jgi:hypothetical protein